jgi:hypothetical protein
MELKADLTAGTSDEDTTMNTATAEEAAGLGFSLQAYSLSLSAL